MRWESGRKKEREKESEQGSGERETSEEGDQGWHDTGQWLGGIWEKGSHPDRRKRGDGRVIRLKRKGWSQTEGNGCRWEGLPVCGEGGGDRPKEQ